MRRVLIAVLLALLPGPLFAAWSNVGALGVNNSTASSGTLTVTTSATLEGGNVGVCVVAYDEGGAGTTDGIVGRLSSVGDGTNTWDINSGSPAGNEFCNMNTINTNDGACVSIAWVKPAANLASGATITFTFPANITAKAATCQEFTIAAGATVVEAAGQNGVANDAADPGNLTVATGVAIEHLFLRGTGCESNVTTFTVDTDYTIFAGSTVTSTADTTVLLTSMGARGDFRIANESTSAANDPTYTAADCTSLMLALDEVTGTSPGWNSWW